jgi:hypothetical protein
MTETDKRWLRWNWGVPDWRDKDAYPKPDDLRLDEWHWEFLRRRPDYRKAWLLLAEKIYRENVKSDPKTKPIEAPNFIACTLHGEERKKDPPRLFVCNPSAPKAPERLISFEKETYGHVTFDAREAWTIMPEEQDFQLSRIIAISFDLKKPIEPQIEEAKKTFRKAREVVIELYGRDQIERKKKNLWPTYLRILDALDANPLWERSDGPCPKFPGKQTWKAIGDAIFLDANLAQKEVDALIKNNPTQAAQDIYRAAKKLRDNFPF